VEQWKPHSQLSRVAIPLLFAAVAPAAIRIGRLLRSSDPRVAPAQAVLLSVLAVGALNSALAYANRGTAPYVTMNEPTRELVRWLRADTPEGSRVMFAGKCVHGYGQGNVAYLPVLTGREMMADDYYGFPVGTIEYEYPPRPFRNSFDRMRLFFDAYNITRVVTYHAKWRDYFRARPEYFAETFSAASRHLTYAGFRLNRESRALYRGDGRVRATFNLLDVTLDPPPPDEAVLCYNWVKGLRSDDGVELFPCEIAEQITLIGVRPRGKREFSIRYCGSPHDR
jgi:hypothetical protein